MERLVLKIKWGGLGDHLLFSPIPRVAKESGKYDKVYISTLSDYRFDEIKRFVWERNYFVDGFVNEDCFYPEFSVVDNDMNLLDKILLLCGIPDDGKRFREPEIFYKPKIITTLQNAIIYDPNYNCPNGHPTSCNIENYFKKNNIQITHQMNLFSFNKKIENIPELTSDSIEHFCNIIFSCKQFFCLTTGSATLAAALGKPATVLYGENMLPMFHHSKLHTYRKLT